MSSKYNDFEGGTEGDWDSVEGIVSWRYYGAEWQRKGGRMREGEIVREREWDSEGEIVYWRMKTGRIRTMLCLVQFFLLIPVKKSKKKVMFVIRVEMKKEERHWTENLLYYLLFWRRFKSLTGGFDEFPLQPLPRPQYTRRTDIPGERKREERERRRGRERKFNITVKVLVLCSHLRHFSVLPRRWLGQVWWLRVVPFKHEFNHHQFPFCI